MKTKAVLMGLASVLCLAACKKEPVCNPPIPGIDLGMSLEQCLMSPFIDSTTWEKDEEWVPEDPPAWWEPSQELWVSADGTYEDMAVNYLLQFDGTDGRELIFVRLAFDGEPTDSIAMSALESRVMAICDKKYGAPKSVVRPFENYCWYEWEACNGNAVWLKHCVNYWEDTIEPTRFEYTLLLDVEPIFTPAP